MKEFHKPKHESPEHHPLAQRAYQLRKYVENDFAKLHKWQDDVYEWDKKLKRVVKERFSSTRFLQQVPGWQAIIGGTPEVETDITDEALEFIENEVSEFLAQKEQELDFT